jgi:LPS export ABC transporter protein LptC
MRPFFVRPAALLAAPLLFGALAAAAEGSDAPPPARTLDLTGLTYVGSDDETNEMVIAADDARVLPEREQVLLADVDLTLRAPGARSALRLRCDHGELDLDTGDFDGIGNVRGRTPDGRDFETERLHYAHDMGLVTSDAPVVIRDKGSALRGGGLSYEVRQGRFQLLGGATVVQQP